MMNDSEKIIQQILRHCSTRYAKPEYPALQDQFEKWSKTRPLAGMRILDATPLFTNTLIKHMALLAAGAELTAATNDVIPYDKTLIPLLDEWGFPHVHNAASGEYDCILDCGGYHAGLNPKYGVAELTRSGFYHYQKTEKPVILVDDSRIKVIETCLGTGNGFFRGMQHFGYTDFNGKKIVLFGYGKVGHGIAFYSARAGAQMTVVDEPGTTIPQNMKFVSRYDKAAIQETVRDAWCIVTATGIADAMKGNGAAEILKNTDQLIAAMGVENEWGDELPEDRILYHGKALNFALDDPTLMCYVAPTMALSNAAVLELITKKLPSGIQKIDRNIENYYWSIIEKYGTISNEIKEAGL